MGIFNSKSKQHSDAIKKYIEQIKTSEKKPITSELIRDNIETDRYSSFINHAPEFTPIISSKRYELFTIMLEKALTDNTKFIYPRIDLYVNPTEMDKNFNKKISEQWTAGGIVTEHSGEEYDMLSFTGTTGGFYTAEHGLNRVYRKHTAAYLQLVSILKLYRNNSYRFEMESEDQNTTRKVSNNLSKNQKEIAGTIKSIGNVVIIYRREVFVGYFEDFEFTEDATKQYTLDYKFNFAVRRNFNSDQPSSWLQPTIGGHTSLNDNAKGFFNFTNAGK